MASHRSLLLASTLLLVAACATQPASDPASGAMLEQKCQRTAKHYQRYQHQGQVVYCKKEEPITSTQGGIGG
jgi:outer membrane biogenesis lipoprotein LolB